MQLMVAAFPLLRSKKRRSMSGLTLYMGLELSIPPAKTGAVRQSFDSKLMAVHAMPSGDLVKVLNKPGLAGWTLPRSS